MTSKEAIANLNHIYGMVAPDIQRSLDVAIKALEERPQGDLISREALKETLDKQMNFDENCRDSVFDIIDNAPTVEAEISKELRQAKETLEMIKKHYILLEKSPTDNPNDLIVGQTSERPQGEWIPVCEKLPEASRWYLVYTKYDDVMTDFFMGDGFMKGDDIIAWQPLPEPYKKGGAE